MKHFHSARFSISLPLPDGPRWRIDDHRTALLRARHEPTQSLVELVIWHEDELVNRQKCEERARDKGFGERAGEEVDTEITAVPEGWDTLVWIGAEKGAHPPPAVTGHLFAFAALVHKCLYLHFSTQADAEVVSDRLAFVRLRVLREMRLDTFDVPRERPDPRPR